MSATETPTSVITDGTLDLVPDLLGLAEVGLAVAVTLFVMQRGWVLLTYVISTVGPGGNGGGDVTYTSSRYDDSEPDEWDYR